jgi:hypothetical protein
MLRSLPMPPSADLVDDKLPIYGLAELCAQVATHRFGPVSPRAIRELWGLEWRIINGRAVTHIPTFLAEAQRRFDVSRVVIGSRRKARDRSRTRQQAA